jgi:hypothetical protein
MSTSDRTDHVEIPEDLAEALRNDRRLHRSGNGSRQHIGEATSSRSSGSRKRRTSRRTPSTSGRANERRGLDRSRGGPVVAPLPHPHHTTNDNVEEQGGDGLMLIIEVSA